MAESCRTFRLVIEKHGSSRLYQTLNPTSQIKNIIRQRDKNVRLLLSALEFCWVMVDSKSKAALDYMLHERLVGWEWKWTWDTRCLIILSHIAKRFIAIDPRDQSYSLTQDFGDLNGDLWMGPFSFVAIAGRRAGGSWGWFRHKERYMWRSLAILTCSHTITLKQLTSIWWVNLQGWQKVLPSSPTSLLLCLWKKQPFPCSQDLQVLDHHKSTPYIKKCLICLTPVHHLHYHPQQTIKRYGPPVMTWR